MGQDKQLLPNDQQTFYGILMFAALSQYCLDYLKDNIWMLI